MTPPPAQAPCSWPRASRTHGSRRRCASSREALDRAEQENRRGRFLEQLAGALDLDDVLARTLEAAHALPGVDATMIVLPQNDARARSSPRRA